MSAVTAAVLCLGAAFVASNAWWWRWEKREQRLSLARTSAEWATRAAKAARLGQDEEAAHCAKRALQDAMRIPAEHRDRLLRDALTEVANAAEGKIMLETMVQRMVLQMRERSGEKGGE